MPWFPGWDSIASTGSWSTVFFWGSIGCLIGLGITEVISHRYAERKDELAAQYQDNTKKQHDEEMARLHGETAKANAQLETARRDIAVAQADTAKANERTAELKLALDKEIADRQARRIAPEQKAKIVELLKPEPKGPVVVVWKMFDEEAEQFGKQLIATLNAAGYEATEGRGAASFGTPGQWVVVRNPGVAY